MWDYLEKDGFLWTGGCGCCAISKHIDTAELLETKPSFPPRLFGAPDLIEDIRKPGVWCAFEKPYAQTDTEYISLAESEHREKEAYARGRADVWTEVKKDLDKIKADHGF